MTNRSIACRPFCRNEAEPTSHRRARMRRSVTGHATEHSNTHTVS